MLCDECKKQPAISHLTMSLNGMVKHLHLCGGCRENLAHRNASYSIAPVTNLSNLLLQFPSFYSASPRNVKTCAVCGMTSTQFVKTPAIGCSACYAELSDLLMPVIKKVQSGVRHMGKTNRVSSPMVKNPSSSHENEITVLRLEQKKAADEERYEDAAVIREKIRLLMEEEGGR
ncbi:MAG: UvrB/UvrC motif-containing protein [Firmicutes bacterium]|nr:UvrB/UvrC motif-containing protein [Bacillota bacterium]